MIYALLSKIVASRIYAILWAKSLRMPGLGGGGQPNLGNACILGASVPGTPPLLHKLFLYSSAFEASPWRKDGGAGVRQGDLAAADVQHLKDFSYFDG